MTELKRALRLALAAAALAFGATAAAQESTPLHEAAVGGSEAVARLLLGAGADPNTKGGQHGWTPLHWAAMYDSGEAVARRLLDAGARRP